MLAAASVLGLLDRVYWPFELANIFRLQYLVVLLAARGSPRSPCVGRGERQALGR